MKGLTRNFEPFEENRYLKYGWDRRAILRNAPEASGVYGLYNVVWIYVGEADNIRARLLEHLAGDNACLIRYRPSGFAFELVAPEARSRRLDELIRQTEPLCNGSFFTPRIDREVTVRSTIRGERKALPARETGT